MIKWAPKNNRLRGVYSITNKLNGAVYIGKATVSFADRWNEHIKAFIDNQHTNKMLSRDYKVFGIDIFEFSIIEVLEDGDDFSKREAFWISEISKKTFCYSNIGAMKLATLRKNNPAFVHRQPSFVWKHNPPRGE